MSLLCTLDFAPHCHSAHAFLVHYRDHTAAEVSDEGRSIRPRSAKKRHRVSYEQNSSQSDSDAEAVEGQQVSEAMADAFAQQAPAEQATPSDDGPIQAEADGGATVGVSGMEAIEAEAGQLFRYVINT